MAESFLTVLILFGATLISSTFGFGSALFAMPLLTLLSGISTATPLFGLVGPTISGIILVRNWRLVELASAWRLIITTLMGIPIGVWLVKYVPGDWVTRFLGIFLIGFGLYRLMNWQLVQLKSMHWAIPFGFIAGILGGAYNTNGPPVVIYGNMRRWSPTEFRATLQSYFLPTGIGILISHAAAGLWNPHLFQLYGLSLPGILAAIAIGGWINQRLPIERFQSLLSGLLVVLGILLWI
ncbi:sulfite exporter TauE/SafE family protein [Oscillatoria sp. CS-180]|uniref:sulfite exporter TauE/SafE family protein n=1 Tax=Oscillatoria sp. CS-180 TaxID=3021720 RepID=UPI002330B2EE|nr:sulfite exporter TauE/SafE family protein [Oscillatoria sp. CS-180]MDB9524975.1 sulfite exporter TauE/SafE family protein [Oscillatoria sp. CS-180]